MRFLAHNVGGGTQSIETLIAWLGKPGQEYHKGLLIAARENRDEAIQTLKIFNNALAVSVEYTTHIRDIQNDLRAQTVSLISECQWHTNDIAHLNSIQNVLEKIGRTGISVQSDLKAIEQVIRQTQQRQYVRWGIIATGAHIVFWLLLIMLYPKSRQIQAIFFWNPWVRRIIGFGYVEFALTWVPFLRAKLFAPFRTSLLSDAALNGYEPTSYYRHSLVIDKVLKQTLTVTQAIPEIKDQVILQGDSGLGKTMFLRHLVRDNKRVVVYLSANRCRDGVMSAIQGKLQGKAKDSAFLRNLIYSGAIDVCIDGLNEVGPDTREKITKFVEEYFSGNIIIGTQPLEWTPPASTKLFTLQPLEKNQIKEFLLSRKLTINEIDASVDYEAAVSKYLGLALKPNQMKEFLDAAYRVLSNPMDLDVVAHMIAHDNNPDLFMLQQAHYQMHGARLSNH